MIFSDPEYNIKQLGLKEGDTVADLGAGSGFYTLAAARVVGPKGKVFSVEVQKDFVERVKSEASKLSLDNIEAIWGDIETLGGTKLAENSVDVAILSNVLFQAEHKEKLAKEISRILKKDGRALVIDWKDSFRGMGPRPESIFPELSAKKLFEMNGFEFEKDISAGDHHYGIIMKHVKV